tara:strand:+ start:472 stop:1311 length:840 start_codon:yes stop_codon:yes gene_type:complete
MNSEYRASCIIGYPAKHSRSPKVHGYWIDKYAIAGDYRSEEIPPEDIDQFISNLAANGYVGANVTMPHKDVAFRLSQPDRKAQRIGAANTLWLDGEVLRSTNTDGDGYVKSLESIMPKWNQGLSRAIVLGAGGASRAIVLALLGYGIPSIYVINRTPAKAEFMRENYGYRIIPANWDNLPEVLPEADLLINTTSLGMHGQPPLELDINLLPSTAIVSDIVYVPLKTPLLVGAEARGLTTTDGLQMLLHQAVYGFELWFGVRPEVTQEQYDLMASDIPIY